MSSQIKNVIKNSKNPKLILEAFEFAKQSYQNEIWLTGENYIDHALRLTLTLQTLGVEEKTVIAGLLHHTLNTSPLGQDVALETISKKFGREVADLAKKASRLNKVYYSIALDVKAHRTLNEQKIENIRKMFFAIAKDIRVILIKLAARVDGMNHLRQLPESLQKTYATETIKIFAPIANRLGLGEIKMELEDAAFEYLHPDQFAWLKEHIKENYEQHQLDIKKYTGQLKRILAKEKIRYLSINYRIKSYWGTYQKLQRHDMDFERIYDLVALRLIVKDVTTCYKALGIIHKYYHPLSGQIQDYIAKPKENGYKSLHTTVFLEKDKPFEIQIKTDEMHQEAQFGICAHWAYKEKIDLAKDPEKLIFSKKTPEFLATFNINFFENQIFVFTPKGDVIILPKDSTPVDFAYALHSDIGNHCEAAKIDGKIIPLSYSLQNGDVVEIITSVKKKPSVDWLQFVKTSFAKSHIKKIFAATFSPILSVPSFVKRKIFRISKEPAKKGEASKVKSPEVVLGGQKGIAVHMAKCCVPQPGNVAKAYLTKHRSAVLHKVSCKNLQKLSELFPEKIIDAIWHES